MSSGFVSGGTAENPTERDAEWKHAQQAIEDQRRAKAELEKQHDGKSLYEILQANKDKKQAEFEEKARFKLHNALDDDEADYLDSVLEKKRQEEASVRKETLEQLHLFRRQQEEAERKALEEENVEAPKEDRGQWAAVGRKRRKGPETGLLKGVKLRKSSSAADEKIAVDRAKVATESTEKSATKPSPVPLPAKSSNPLSLGLGYASSEDEA